MHTIVALGDALLSEGLTAEPQPPERQVVDVHLELGWFNQLPLPFSAGMV